MESTEKNKVHKVMTNKKENERESILAASMCIYNLLWLYKIRVPVESACVAIERDWVWKRAGSQVKQGKSKSICVDQP